MSSKMNPTDFLDAMAPRGRIDSLMLSEVLKSIVWRSVEAHGVHLSEVASHLAAGGAVDLSSARVGDSRSDIRAFAPPTGDPWVSALAIRNGDDLFVACIEMSGKPDPELDNIFADIIGYVPGEVSQPDPREVSRVDLFRLPVDGDLGKLFSDAGAGWGSGCLFGCSFSDNDHKTGRWDAGHVQLHADGLDHWTEAFAVFRSVLKTLGGQSRIANDAAAFGSRNYSSYLKHTPALAHFEAAASYGDHLAGLDDYLPSASCVTGISDLLAAQVGRDLQGSVDMLFRIHEACIRADHVSDDREFDFNDLNNFVHAAQDGDMRLISLSDQNRRHRAKFRTDEGGVIIEVFSAPVDAPAGSETPLAQVIVPTDGVNAKPEVITGPGIGGDDIRAWNSFVGCVESADCCLDEEYGQSSPSP